MDDQKPEHQESTQAVAHGLRGGALFLAVWMTSLSGCGSTGTGLQKISDGALEVVGLKKDPAQLQLPQLPKAIPVRIVAGQGVNADPKGRGISVVVKLYKLRDAQAFVRMPYEQLATDAGDASGNVLQVKDIVLAPGKQYGQDEAMPAEAKYLGVAVQFRSPAPERWRFAFAVDANAKNGILIGLHECAMTVSQGVLYEAPVTDPGSLNAVHCVR
ncbi:type VI secretion system lipoprotein TssJ [Niveibacterium sp. SC-1]|uniref:type VI secretion system lipoprotein TssJ n=1 Tax=Niveibacterium sp. SC-1 TaxID=3135646 RepID=UPI00311E8826